MSTPQLTNVQKIVERYDSDRQCGVISTHIIIIATLTGVYSENDIFVLAPSIEYKENNLSPSAGNIQ